MAYIWIEFNDEKIKYAENHAKSEIKNRSSEADRETLLNYPVVYIHTWKDEKDQPHIYVGETIDLVNRTKQHKEAEQDKQNRRIWQEKWKAGKERYSLYFSCSDMNKSLSLDIEDSLYNLFCNYGCGVANSRGNEQPNYNNKDKRDAIVKELYEEVKKTIVPQLPDYSVVCNSCLTKYTEYKPVDVWYSQPFLGVPDLINRLEAQGIEAIKEYPVVYIHVWIDNNNILNVYVGEANDILVRTQQHFDGKKEDYRIDLQRKILYDKNEDDWRKAWKVAIKNNRAYMFIYCKSGEMNKSLTLDLENRLINYSIIQGFMSNGKICSQNGRTNPQKRYSNMEKCSKIYKELVGHLSGNDKAFNDWLKDNGFSCRFETLEEIKKKSIFMASPLLFLSEDQRKAKDEVKDSLIEKAKSCDHTVYVIQGGVGTGKTVIASSLFFDLLDSDIDVEFLVNQDELHSSYNTQIAAKYNDADFIKTVQQPAEFINSIKAQYIDAALSHVSREGKEQINRELAELLGSRYKYDRDTKLNIIRKVFSSYKDCEENKSDDLDDEIKKQIQKIKFTGDEIEKICNTVNKKPEIKVPDVVIIDEGHLVARRGIGGAASEDQLAYIVNKVKITVVVLDMEQFVNKKAVRNGEEIELKDVKEYLEQRFKEASGKDDKDDDKRSVEILVSNILKEQFRMKCSDNTLNWLHDLSTSEKSVRSFVEDSRMYSVDRDKHLIVEKNEKAEKVYEIKVCESVSELIDTVYAKVAEGEIPAKILATYNWQYTRKVNNKNVRNAFKVSPYENKEFMWHVTGGQNSDIWIKSGTLYDQKFTNRIELGAYHDIQGFDLKYAGVIIGGAFSYKEGKITIDKGQRTDSAQTQEDYVKTLISNELWILLTRGIDGLCIYACDEALRKALLDIF